MTTDQAMENIAVYDALKREGFSEAIINRIEHAVNSHEELIRLLKAMRDQIDKHFYKLPEDNENDGKYWKRLYDSACELITQAEGK